MFAYLVGIWHKRWTYKPRSSRCERLVLEEHPHCTCGKYGNFLFKLYYSVILLGHFFNIMIKLRRNLMKLSV